jgi:hypothetical protein
LHDDGDGCEGLAEAVVTSLVMMVESAEAGDAAAPAPPPDRRGHAELAFGALGVVGALRGVRPAAWAEARADLGSRVSAGLGAAYLLPSSFERGGVDVTLGLFFAQAEACALARAAPRFSLRACAAGALGALSGEATRVDRPSPRWRAWVAPAAALVVSAPPDAPLGWWARLGAWVPVRRHGFTVEGVGLVFDPPPVAFGLGGGVRWATW